MKRGISHRFYTDLLSFTLFLPGFSILGQSRSRLSPKANEIVRTNGFGKGWAHYGWAPNMLKKGITLKIIFGSWNGRIIAEPMHTIASKWPSFQNRTEVEKEFLKVTLGNNDGDQFPLVIVHDRNQLK